MKKIGFAFLTLAACNSAALAMPPPINTGLLKVNTVQASTEAADSGYYRYTFSGDLGNAPYACRTENKGMSNAWDVEDLLQTAYLMQLDVKIALNSDCNVDSVQLQP
jgi:hypothetical protein